MISINQNGKCIMLLLGIASLLQIMLLPGLLALLLSGTAGGVVRTILMSFALSLVMNFYLTALLVSLKLYTAPNLYLILTAEITALLFLTRGAINQPIGSLLSTLRAKFNYHRKELSCHNSRTERLLALASLLTLALFLFNYLSAIGSIFDHGDDIVSWNRWAVDWYNGYFPRMTWNYPQLLPANWSISYLFLNGSTLQCFAKSICPLFSLFLLLAMYDLWMRRQDFSFLCAIPVTAFLCLALTGASMNKGYADLPVAFLSFMSVYVLLAGKGDIAAEQNKNIVLGSLCCAGAALTKQAGLYVVGIYPLLCYLLACESFRLLGRMEKARKFASIYLLLFVLTAPWYLYTAAKIMAGREESEIKYVTHGIYLGRSMWGRLLDFCDKIKQNLDLLISPVSSARGISTVAFLVLIAAVVGICLLLAFFLAQSLSDRSCRYLVVLIIVPYLCIWARFFSYDFRNLAIAFPFIGLAAGNGIYRRLKVCRSAR
jgi:hypothetical protein